MSEDYCGFLDPREKVWKGESGKGYYLKNLVHGCSQALEPFDGIFGFSKRVPQYTGQTLFRFPLRNKASALSSEIYTVQKLEKLLELLNEEAQYLLIFLRSVCAIEVYRITEKNETLPIFSVSVSQKDYQTRSSNQKQLLAQVKSTFSSSYPHEIIMDSSRFTLEVVVNGSIASEHELLVVNQVGSEDNEVMRLAEKQHVLPWVGTAVELAPSDSSGRVFCVLPLPIEDRTPFVVHVNGTFAVSSNRRSLKWEAQERKGDEESTWNKLLIEKCIPDCYFTLITELMELPNIDPSTVYSCWPVLQKVNDTSWNGLLEPFYELLLYNDKAVHCVLEDSQWISIEDSVIIPDDEAVYPIIKQVVLNCGVNLVELESNQHIALNEYYDENIQHLTPSKVRKTLKKKLSAYDQLSAHDKMVILQYCLADNCVYANLIGLELLPLANGFFKTFAKINRSPSQSLYVYICSPAAPVSLLPDVKHKLINVHNRYPNIHRNLIRISKHDYSMVKQLTPGVVSNLLLKCKTNEWSSKQMKLFWNWLQDKDLSNFQSRKIVPTKHHATNSVNIVPLVKGNGVVYVSQNIPLPLLLATGFEKCGIKFANAHEFSYLSHSQIGQYLYCFKPNQVLDAITLISVGNIKFSNNEAIAIQNLFSKSNFNDSRLATISRLPLFKVLQNVESVRTSINAAKTSNSNNKAIAMKGSYNFKIDLLPNEPLIVECISNDTKLLKKLESIVCFMSETDYLQKVAFVQIENQMFESSDIVPFMQSVLDNFYSPAYKQVIRQLTSAMRTLPFVRVSSTNTLEAPCKLFDPENEMLNELFLGENKFPASNFRSYLPILQQCGLRLSVTSSEILHVIQLNQAAVVINHIKANIDHVKYCKIVAALKYLFKHSALLYDIVSKHYSLLYTLQKQASQYCWLPVASNPPNSYPSCLAWKGSQYPSSLASASAHPLVVLSNDLASSKLPLIIGSQAVFVENVPTQLANHLCSSSKYLTPAVATHFKLVSEKCEEMSAEKLKTISMQTYNYLLQNIDNCDAQMLGNEKWIWLENISSFTAPTQVAVADNPSFRASLEPYVFVLPSNLRKFSQLFIKCGVSPTITTGQILSVLKSLKNTPEDSQLRATEAWSIVTSILTWLAEDTERIDEGNFLVPVESDLSYPQLYCKDEVSYTDNEILRDIANASDEEYHLIHPKVSHLAPILGLTPLSDKLDITEDIFDDAGQHEPLATRLSNILREYKDGLTIIKEMIQNADDAGATEVNILYDNRTHSTDNLLFKGMAESHGPALIIHNNSTFTEEDFENITKLAGATKANQPLKIGKFGVGFCSVYHITDIPSFVSGEWLYIFDPTLKYLKGVVLNESRPGKRLKYRSSFVVNSQQLAPYQGLFGFDASSNYKGTIFRLPFRTHASQISSTLYNDYLVQMVKDNLKENGSKLLLFLKHVKHVSFTSVQNNSSDPTMELLIDCSNELSDIKNFVVKSPDMILHHYWLISCQEEILKTQDGNLKPGTASIACQLVKEGSYSYTCKAIEGNAFCFLPLSVPSTGLPVHISANFAVMSNRSSIWTEGSSGVASDSRERWNQQLLTTIIPRAYCNLLKKLQALCISRSLLSYDFYTMWPLTASLNIKYPWENLIPVLYQLISQEELFYSAACSQWLALAQAWFFPPSLFQIPRPDINVPFLLHKAAIVMKLLVVSLPESYFQQLQAFSNDSVNIVTEYNFLKIFSNNITDFVCHISTRNEVISIILSAIGTGEFHLLKQLLKNFACVPTSPGGIVLKLASHLVDPYDFCSMFDPEDEMFPLDSFYQNALTREALFQLGLMTPDKVSWEIIISSARTVESLYVKNKKKAFLRIKKIIKCIESMEKSIYASSELNDIFFLPVLPKPKNYMLPWKAENHNLLPPCQVICAASWSSRKTSLVVGSQKGIINTSHSEKGCGRISSHALEFLEIPSRPSIDDVHRHYLCLIDFFNPAMCENPETEKLVNDICQYVYEFYDGFLQSYNGATWKHVFASFQNKPFIFTGKGFVCPMDVAINWKEADGPYLYKLNNMLSEYKSLLQYLHIKEKFSINKLLVTLHEMYNDFSPTHQLPPECHKIVDNIISELNSADIVNMEEEVYLADHNYVLRPAEDLVFNDAPSFCTNDDNNYVISSLNQNKALALGVISISNKFLDKFVSVPQSFNGVLFGQKEQITQRIKNTLKGYPLDVSFLKELLQNADDANASKMVVILDKRQHGKERVPSKEWGEELQGPALLVWNDKNFTDKDLEGIQRLGLGSKRDDVDSIGQFGIGFNVVYHLTDCPSFITRGNTLCVFDPHCRYVPGTDASCPGRLYDINDEFLANMSDLRSCFLQDDFQNKPPELNKGVLFRLPLRCALEHSGLVNEQIFAEPLTADTLELYLNEWVPFLKESLLFLNYVTQFEYFIIEDSGIKCKASFVIKLAENSHEARISFNDKLSNFMITKQPFLVMYSLSLETRHPETMKEQWLVQQGVGDICEPDKNWAFIPKHGIAATHERSSDFKGKVFCVIPLAEYTNFPVHINGHFFLNYDGNSWSRWISATEKPDDKNNWNDDLIEAITSSYIHFLKLAQPVYVASYGYSQPEDLFNAVNAYYSLFPFWSTSFQYEEEEILDISTLSHKNLVSIYTNESMSDWAEVASRVLAMLWSTNASVLAVERIIYGRSAGHATDIWLVEWHLLHNDENSFKQAYLLPRSYKNMRTILNNLGMLITCAPEILYLRFLFGDIKKPAIITPESVFHFYSSFHAETIAASCPCDISETPFLSVENFCSFLSFTFSDVGEIESYFPNSPILLTADSQLRVIEMSSNVLLSKYGQLFPINVSQFVHENLIETYKKITYFTSPENVPYSVISDLMKVNFPEMLQNFKANNSESTLITSEKLKHLWECLCSDDIFKHHQNTIVHNWALIPANTGSLYSASSPIRPLVPPSHDDDKIIQEMYKVLTSFTIPVYESSLEWDFDSQVQVYCIQLKQVEELLKMLYYVNEQCHIFNNLKDQKNTVKGFYTFLCQINFEENANSLKYFKSLPLFESIQGQFVSLEGKTVLNSKFKKFCIAGYNKWASECNLVFVNELNTWSDLKTSIAALKVKEIQLEDIYANYILPKFNILTAEERKEQLTFMRKSCFATNSFMRKHLLALHCLETKSGELQRVSYFFDHTVPIFSAFNDQDSFVPKEYQTEEWLEFFKLLHLQTTVTTDNFKHCCQIVASDNDCERSSVLVSYLFSHSAAEWHLDSQFLSEIGNIPFVKVDTLERLNWIKMPHKVTGLTKLNEAVLHDSAELVWTVKTVVQISSEFMSTHEYQNFLNKASLLPEKNETYFQLTLRRLGVTIQPEVDDVFNNLLNISQIYLSCFNLFDSYDLYLTNFAVHIEVVITKSLSYLFEKEAIHHLQRLQFISCIPVSADKIRTRNFITKPVLVKPVQIVRDISNDCNHLFPYLHLFPHFMYNLDYDLRIIGISDRITLKTLQYLLETMHQQLNGSVMSPNDAITVREAVIKINNLLEASDDSKVNVTSQLSPLFLPDADGHLVKSTDLVFIDTTRYQDTIPNFVDTPYSLFQLPGELLQSQSVVRSVERQLSFNLSKKLRPFGLSVICREFFISGEFGNNAHLTRHFENLKSISPQLHSVLLKIFAAQLRSSLECTSEMRTIDCFVSTLIDEFIADIEVVVIKNLMCDLKLIVTDNSVGIVSVQFLFQKSDYEKLILYVDETANPGTVSFSKEMAFMLCLEIARLHGVELATYFAFLIPLQECLMAQSEHDLMHTLEKFELNTSNLEAFPALLQSRNLVACGKEIPDDMANLLQMDINHMFHPEEWVGYEITEGHVVYALVLCHITSEIIGDQNGFERQYKIRLDDSNDGTRLVFGLDLYKFVNKKQLPALVSVELENKRESLIRKISHSLDIVWKITDEDVYKKAIKCLYMQYHPDKVNQTERDVYKEAFTFLQGNLKDRTPPSFISTGLVQSLGEKDFNQWNNFAQQTYQRESPTHQATSSSHAPSSNLLAEMWLRQARSDLEAIKVLKEQLLNKELHCQVLFLAHETCEKALMAGMYMIGLNPDSCNIHHDLSIYANAIACNKSGKWSNLAYLVRSMEKCYHNSRFPSEHFPPSAPIDVYSAEKAASVAEDAEAVFDLITLIFEEKEAKKNVLGKS